MSYYYYYSVIINIMLTEDLQIINKISKNDKDDNIIFYTLHYEPRNGKTA